MSSVLPTTRQQPSNLLPSIQGAIVGATSGAIGVIFVSGVGSLHQLLEIGMRSVGGEPRWPILDEDCALPAFKNLTFCTDPQTPVPFALWASSLIAVSTLGGAVLFTSFSNLIKHPNVD